MEMNIFFGESARTKKNVLRNSLHRNVTHFIHYFVGIYSFKYNRYLEVEIMWKILHASP